MKKRKPRLLACFPQSLEIFISKFIFQANNLCLSIERTEPLIIRSEVTSNSGIDLETPKSLTPSIDAAFGLLGKRIYENLEIFEVVDPEIFIPVKKVTILFLAHKRVFFYYIRKIKFLLANKKSLDFKISAQSLANYRFKLYSIFNKLQPASLHALQLEC